MRNVGHKEALLEYRPIMPIKADNRIIGLQAQSYFCWREILTRTCESYLRQGSCRLIFRLTFRERPFQHQPVSATLDRHPADRRAIQNAQREHRL